MIPSLITATTNGSNVLPVSLLQETQQQQTRCLCKHGNFSPLLPLRKMPSLIEPGCVIFSSACGILTNGHVLISRPLNVHVHPAACACVHAVDHVKFETMKIYSKVYWSIMRKFAPAKIFCYTAMPLLLLL